MAGTKFLTLAAWASAGAPLARVTRRDVWAIGDWWLAGAAFGLGARKAMVTASGWQGPGYDSCKVYGCVARRFPSRLRYHNLDFTHYQTVAALADQLAMSLLQQAMSEAWSVNVLRTRVARIRHARACEGGDIANDLQELITLKRTFRAVLADPPWRFRAAETSRVSRRHNNDVYYPSMATEDICRLPIPQIADPRSFLFLWCPSVMLEHALNVMRSWGYEYKTNLCWDKMHGFGSGYYFRMRHELLLLGRMPQAPRHFDDPGILSVLRVRRSATHSEKPTEAHSIVQRACPGRYLELFGRRAVPGWTVLGNQLAQAESTVQLAAD
jgi:N6-adenosine-specific RNA methylase IME4